MSFYTVINCIDGRIQLPVLNYLIKTFDVPYIDNITEPGPVKLFWDEKYSDKLDSILKKVDISLRIHDPKGIAIMAHYDCAGNPEDIEVQLAQLWHAKKFLDKRYPHMQIHAIWLNQNWDVHNVKTEEDIQNILADSVKYDG